MGNLKAQVKITEEVKQLLIKYKVEHSDIVYSQMVVESSSGTSRLAREDNNLFGMKYPTQRTTTAIGKTKSGFAKFKSIEDCVLDLRIWQLYFTKGFTRQQYIKYLSKNYAEDGKYIKKLLGE